MKAGLKNFEERTRFVDGNEYVGTWNALGMDGIGTYILPHSAKFDGEFRDDTFHGYGSVRWPRGQRMDGIWSEGECKDKRYIFEDGLIFLENGWEYCNFPDRRFVKYVCLETYLSTLRNNKKTETLIPPFCYDAGIGIFNPYTYCIASYRDPNKVVEIPTAKMVQWIQNHCQKAWTEPTGHREILYENWFSRKGDATVFSLELLPFSNASSESWWKRYKTFQ
ncbi:PREDICTED: MORN repeat-containing protein 5 [Dufourea novaeangliae]|uniref:MORN repeat-containing protein 5 n=1 Tax=Dufourea novaeangliae TaxID=178035 RepID=UPI0007670E4B|nr:PREDICTED: MORN repeat-containing protein 5 [Dufourea novaeangliae]